MLVVFGATGSLRLLRDVLYPHHIGLDGRLYTDASRVWLAGGDPWTTTYEFGHPLRGTAAIAPRDGSADAPALGDGRASSVVVVSAVLALAAIRSLGLPGLVDPVGADPRRGPGR